MPISPSPYKARIFWRGSSDSGRRWRRVAAASLTISWSRSLALITQGALALRFPILAQERVAQDREHPGFDACARLELSDVAPSAQDRVLHQVVGTIRVAGQR